MEFEYDSFNDFDIEFIEGEISVEIFMALCADKGLPLVEELLKLLLLFRGEWFLLSSFARWWHLFTFPPSG